MSDTHEPEKTQKGRKALAKFGEFVHNLRVNQPKVLGLNDRDSNDGRPVTVTRTDALNCFLGENPSYKECRDELSKYSPHEKWFDFNEESWKKKLDEGAARGDS